jgi:uncharacterized membrane protein YphA (DoxX/SURF4 family)
MPLATSPSHKKTHVLLWVIQWLLALLFVYAGGMKLVMPIGPMAAQSHVPGLFLRFIGVLELLGGLGLVLPGLLGLNPALTPLAAAGLVVIMSGAVGASITTAAPALAVIPVGVGLLAAFVAYGRWQIVPLRARRAGAHGSVLRTAE